MREEPSNREPPLGLVARMLEIGSNDKTEGISLEEAAKIVGQHLAHRLSPKTIAKEIFATVTDKLIPQGADELAHALFGHGRAYAPHGYHVPRPIKPEGHGVHGPEPTPEELAAQAIEFEALKAAARMEARINTEVASMAPEEQKFADNFRQPPEPSEPDEPAI